MGLETKKAVNCKLYKLAVFNAFMEMVKVPKDKYKNMLKELRLLRELKGIYWNFVRQFKMSLEDVKAGRIRMVA